MITQGRKVGEWERKKGKGRRWWAEPLALIESPPPRDSSVRTTVVKQRNGRPLLPPYPPTLATHLPTFGRKRRGEREKKNADARQRFVH